MRLPFGVPWERPTTMRRRWYRHGRPWEVQHLYLEQVTDDGGGWLVSWTAERDDLLYDDLDEATAAIEWVLSHDGEWVEVDPSDIRRVIGDGRPPPSTYPRRPAPPDSASHE